MQAITVLIPVRNTGRYLRETIESVQAQTFRDWKLIAIDDGSTDNSPAILAQFAKEDPRIIVVTRENRGLVATRNQLLEMADSEFIAWLDSDDRMTPERLGKQLERFYDEDNLVCLGGAAILTDPDSRPILQHGFPTTHEELLEPFKEEISVYFSSVMMRRDAAIKVGGFRQPFAISEDYDICLRLSEIGRVGNLAEVVLLYRQHMASTANAGRAKAPIYSNLVRELAEERRKTGSDRLMRGEKVELSFKGLPSKGRIEADTYRRWGWWALGSGHVGTAKVYAKKAVMKRPWSPAAWRLLACAIRGH